METKDLNSKEIKQITKILDKELSKSEDKINMDVVNECFRKLDELQGGACKKTEAELEEGLIKIKKGSDRIQAEIAKNEIARSCEAPRKMPLRRSFALAALSVFLVIGLSFSALALSLGGYSKAWNYISDSVKTLFNIKPSESTVDGIEIIKGEYTNIYDNIEVLLREENIDMLYPSKLPDGVKIEAIRYIDLIDGKYKIFIQFNSLDFNMSFYNFPSSNLDMMVDANIYTPELTDFYIVSKNENSATVYNAIAQYKNCEYIINSDTYENLILIIDNLTEVTK